MNFIFQYLKFAVVGYQTYSTGLACLSGSHDIVVDVGLMSIEMIFNEFIQKVREERENDCWLKLTSRMWEGKNIALEIKGEENSKHKCGVSSGQHYKEQSGRLKARSLATFESSFSIMLGWKSTCHRVSTGLQRCVRTVRVRISETVWSRIKLVCVCMYLVCLLRETKHV